MKAKKAASSSSVYSSGNGRILSGRWSSRVRPGLPFRLQNWAMITTLWRTVFADIPDFINVTTKSFSSSVEIGSRVRRSKTLV